jgi:uncharacterized membrane protein YdjX (TVP38/TMEM64 family)
LAHYPGVQLHTTTVYLGAVQATGEPAAQRPARPGRRLGGRAAVVVFFAVIGTVTLAGAGLLPEPQQFRQDVDSWGALGVLAVLALALVHAVLPYPAELLCLATGYAYGFVPALALMLTLWPASCLLAYWLARRWGRALAHRTVDRGALERAERGIADTGPVPLLLLRVIPIVPFNFVSYAAGMFHVPLRRFLLTTAAGIAPQLTLVTYAGSRADDLSPSDPRVWLVGGGWLLLVVAGLQVYRRVAPAAAAP